VVLQPKPLMPRQAPSIASPPNSLQISSPGLIHVGPAPAWNGRGGGFALGKCWRSQHACIVMALALQGRSSAQSIIDAHESSEAQPLQSNGHTINLRG
jgi:hypothetical protein